MSARTVKPITLSFWDHVKLCIVSYRIVSCHSECDFLSFTVTAPSTFETIRRQANYTCRLQKPHATSLGLLATAKLLVSTHWCPNVCGTYHYQFVFDSLKCIYEQL